VLWTGYKYNDIKDKEDFKYILENIDYLIDGPFILKERDITLKWRGSRNQNIRDIKTGEIIND
jgi:anaerobic ribonucleoside-triphosphate reductase activating protein